MNKQSLPKTLIIGAKSFLGSRLYHAFLKEQGTVLGTHYSKSPNFSLLDLHNVDLSDCNFFLKGCRYAIISAAMTKISQCEKEKDLSWKCNVEGTLTLVQKMAEQGITPIVFSSDFVFDGNHGNYVEESPLHPLNEYGRQKAFLEKEVPKICKDNFILLRLGKLFGIEKDDKTLFDEMLTLLSQKKTIKAATDHIFCPIWVNDVIHVILEMEKKNMRGLYNLCGEKSYSRLSLALLTQELLGIKENLVEKIFINDLDPSLVRPCNISMNSRKLFSEISFSTLSPETAIQILASQYR